MRFIGARPTAAPLLKKMNEGYRFALCTRSETQANSDATIISTKTTILRTDKDTTCRHTTNRNQSSRDHDRLLSSCSSQHSAGASNGTAT